MLFEDSRCNGFSMIEIFLFFCLLSACGLLVVLSVIDLRIGLLPNVHNGALALFGIVFHGVSGFEHLSLAGMALGAFMGGGLLYAVRFVANRYYGQDALGLGDVKLLAAAGIWLGADSVLIALVIGAMAGLVHGFIVIGYTRFRTQETITLSTFSIPAGPGFCMGIFCAGLAMYLPFIQTAFS